MSHVPTMAYRALLEGWASFMWRRFSGVLIWKTQNPWAGLRGQLYDWLLAPTGGYYGVMLACEAVHVQLNLYSCQVCQLVLLIYIITKLHQVTRHACPGKPWPFALP